MANIYFPQASNVLQRTTNGSGYTEIVLDVVPNTVMFFDTSSALISMSATPMNLTASWAVTASYALNGGGGPITPSGLETGSTYPITSSWSVTSSYALSSSYINQSEVKIESGSAYIKSNLSNWWKLSVFEDGSGIGTLQLEGPY